MEVTIKKPGEDLRVIPFVTALSVDAIKSLRIVREHDDEDKTMIEFKVEEWQKITIEK